MCRSVAAAVLGAIVLVAAVLLIAPQKASALSFSNIRAENVIGSGAQIKWDTDAPGDSQVFYGTLSGYYPYSFFGDCSGATSTFNHCVNLTGLAASTRYYYKVKSRDISGVEYTSEENYFDSASGNLTAPSGSAPAAPSGLVASSTATTVGLFWTDNSTDETAFKISRRPSGGSWSFVATVGANATQWSESGLAAGTYDYHVNACNSYGCSPDSNIATATISGSTSDTQAPSTPTGLAATAQSSSQINLSWSASTDNVGVSGYKIYRNGAYLTSVSGTSYSDTGLSAGTSYSYAVAAYDAAGNVSAQSANVSATTSAYIAATTTTAAPFVDLKVDGADGTATRPAPASYTLTWNTLNAASCTPEGTWSGSGAKSVPSGSYYFTGISVLGLKTYTLACVNAYGTVARDTIYVDVVSSTTKTTLAVLKGTVADEIGRVVSGASVHIFNKDFSRNFGAITAADGTFSINLPGDTYFVELFPPQARTDLIKPPPAGFGISDGETKSLDLKFSAIAKTISGKVAFSNGAAVTDAEVGAYSEEFREWKSAFTQSDGGYVLKVGAGRWRVGVRPREPEKANWSWSGPFNEVDFTRDGSLETRFVNFTIQLADAKLVVKVEDEAAKALAGVGVVADTISASDAYSPVRPPPQYKKSDENGLAAFTLQKGNYYIRAFLLQEAGYLHPQERQISISAGETAKITLVFRRPTPPETVKVFGTAKLADGRATDAFIWGWSEKGGNVSTRSNAAGEFIVSLERGTRWHIGAGKELDGVPYKSGEIIVDTSAPTGLVELVLERFGTGILAPFVSVSQPAAERIVARTKDGAEVRLPPAAAGPSGAVTVEVTPTIEVPSLPAAQVIGTAYDIKVINPAGEEVKSLAAATEIVIPYDPEELKRKGVTEDAVVPSFFDESTGVWVKVNDYSIDKTRKVFILRVTHLTRFALVAAADVTPPQPPTNVAASYGADGSIVITWTNPAADFSHARVYRSTERGFLGDVVATNLTRGTFVDRNIAAGVVYYYTVRAVDLAGNETSNRNQAALEALRTVSALPPGQAVKAEILRNLKVGASGDDVKALQQLLLDEGVYPAGLITGYFGDLTRQAVIRFQEKYADEILTPAGLTKGNGFVGPATRKKINELLGIPPSASPKEKPAIPLGQETKLEILRDLSVGASGDDVKALQQLLLDEGVYPAGLITGYFGDLTRQAVIRFQEKYADAILTPAGLSAGTGFVGPATRAKINALAK